MTDQRIAKRHHATFDSIRQQDAAGNEYWSARKLAKVLEYSEYRHFQPVIERAREACRSSGYEAADHFEDILEMVCCLIPAAPASFSCPLNDRLKVSILRILQHLGKLACGPVFVTRSILLANTIEGGVMPFGNALICHGVSPVRVSKASAVHCRAVWVAARLFIRLRLRQ